MDVEGNKAVTSKRDSLTFAIQSLDTLNDQIVQFIFTPKSSECDYNGVKNESKHLVAPERDTLKSSLALMRRLLVDAQIKFRRMVDEKEKLASDIGSSLQDTNEEVSALRTELENTNKRLNEISEEEAQENNMVTNMHQDNKEWQKQQDEEELHQLRDRCRRLEADNDRLREQARESKTPDGTPLDFRPPPTTTATTTAATTTTTTTEGEGDIEMRLTRKDHELAKVKEALTIMKNDRKRLKGEKVDLLNQMKQLYCTLEAKEEEMRDFIRNYEQRMAESERRLERVAREKEEAERDHWEILRRAREAAERSVSLRAQLDQKQKENESAQDEVCKLRKLLSSADRNNSTTSMPHITITSTPVSASQSSLESTSMLGVEEIPSTDSESRELLLSAIPMSRSTEDVCNMDGSPKEKKQKKKQKKFNSLSRIFSKKNRPLLESIVFDDTNSTVSLASSSQGSVIDLFALDDSEKDRLAAKCRTLPMMQWKASMVVAWLERILCLPEYVRPCAENVKSGQVLLGLSDAELEVGIGVSKTLHKRKLRLAIEEHRHPSKRRYPKISDLDHKWVAKEWLKDIGLGQYSSHFETERVDGRVLNTLSRKDLDKLLSIGRKFHQVTILHAIELLRTVEFDKRLLCERRAQSEEVDCDPLVWTTQRLIKWARSIDLKEYAENLEDSGVHGALLVSEMSFDADAMSNALGIPTSKTIIRRHLATELNAIIRPARAHLQSQIHNDSDSRRRSSSSLSNTSRSFQRSYRGSSDEGSKSKATFRGSLGRALGRKMKQDMNKYQGMSFSEDPDKMRSKSRSQDLSSTPV